MAIKDIDLKYQSGRAQLNGSLNISAVSGAPNAATLPLGNTSKAASTGINLIGSFAGGEDDSNGTDSTPRINTYSYQRASTNSFGEIMRNWLMRWDSKAMLSWYGPQATGTQQAGYDGNGDALTTGVTWKPWAWLGAHYEANDHASVHGHISIEVPDTTGALQTRLEILFADRTTGLVGLDKTFIITNQADFVVRCSNGQVLRMAAAAGTEKAIEFHNDTFGATASRRWKLRANSTAESGSNAGTDFELVRYDDTGTAVDGPIFVTRSNGQVVLGTSNSSGVIIRRSNSSSGNPALQVQANTSGGSGIEVQTQISTSRILQSLVSGDTQRRFYIDTAGIHQWGDGSSTQDTNLYRLSANNLATDDKFNAVGLVSATDGTAAAATLSTSADGTASLGVLAINPSSTSKRAVDIRLSADTVSRIRMDFSASGSGTVTLGDGTNADTNLYRKAANILATDDAFYLANISTPSTQTGGGVLYATSGAPAWKDASGNTYDMLSTNPQPSDHGLVSWSMDPNFATATTTSVAGTLYLGAVYIRKPVSITKLWWMWTAGPTTPTAGQNWAGLFDSSGNLVASASTDAVTGNGPKNITVSSTALSPGFYWVGLIQNASVQPIMARSGGQSFGGDVVNQSTATLRFAVNGTGLTALPSPITPASNSQTGAAAIWVAVS